MPAKKTLDQITQDAINSNFGISDEDLALLFEDEAGNEPSDPDVTVATPSVETVPPAQPANTATNATTPVVNAVTTPVPPPEPAKGVDVSSLENSIKLTNEQVAQLALSVQELLRKSQTPNPATQSTQQVANPMDEVDDQAIITKPKDSIVKLMTAMFKMVLPAAFAEYDTGVQKRIFVEKFRETHPDFEELRPLMRQIIAEDAANNDVLALPRVYAEAKKRREAELERVKRHLIPETPPSPAVHTLDEGTLAQLEQRLVERARQRRAVSGTLTSEQTTPVSPANRQTVTPKEKPLSDEEKMFLEMLNSGPPSEKFLKGLELHK